ncbi:MAG: saccharopine dehydrogenase family protein [Pseudomonadota bacterium]
MTVHWCGTGLSAIPGLARLVDTGIDIIIWNRTVEKAKKAFPDPALDIRQFDLNRLDALLGPGDVVVSMLPGNWHVPLAETCLRRGAHFVSSSYISPEMRALDKIARDHDLRLVNEVGLDPGIDHLMAHALLDDYRNSDAFDPGNAISFKSYCGGVPKVANALRYKFSWSPAGVLKALRAPSRSIRAFSTLEVARPWDAITSYTAPLPSPEVFEVYPNRDSLPFMNEYGISKDWPVKEFVRGTLRLNGWADAWADIFTEIEGLDGAAGDARLEEMSEALWQENSYGPDDPDRVVLCVELLAEDQGMPVFHKTYVMDAWGDMRGTAMARLVSVPVSLAVESVLAREIPPGVSAAPSDQRLVIRWMAEVDRLAQHLQLVDHLAK